MVNIQGAFFAWTRFSKIASHGSQIAQESQGKKTLNGFGSFSVPAAVIKSASLLKHNLQTQQSEHDSNRH